ncbi:hypothetical protein ABIA13_003895, partial [Sinorhizobium fredii]
MGRTAASGSKNTKTLVRDGTRVSQGS